MSPWLAEHAAVLLNRCEVSNDRAAAYKRLKGKEGAVHGIGLGEYIFSARNPCPTGWQS